MSTQRLTPAMVAALRLASERPIAYYRGAWYAPAPQDGDAPHMSQTGRVFGAGDVTTTSYTLSALVTHGMLSTCHADAATVYALRWHITDAGRNALAREDARR